MFLPLGMRPLPFPVLSISSVSSYRCDDYPMLDNQPQSLGFLHVVIHHSPCIGFRSGKTGGVITVFQVTFALAVSFFDYMIHPACDEVS